MECYEKGLITKKETDGLELNWGDGGAVVALTEKIAKREGIGAVLADGVKKAAELIGHGAEAYAMHVGGHRLPYHDPRGSPSLGAFYVADAQPACHMGPQGMGFLEQGQDLGPDALLRSPKFEYYGNYNQKGAMYATGAAYFQLLSSSGLCALYTINFAVPVVDLLVPVTGWDLNWGEGLRIGKRILTLRQAFNAREGLKPDTFKLPRRLMAPLTVGPAEGQEIDFESLKKGYFEAMGWDFGTGKPNNRTVADLGLGSLVD
jgi:aldehyde:ferredoxin oxidoreductase